MERRGWREAKHAFDHMFDHRQLWSTRKQWI